MRILMIASELAPLAKTGGLADAVAGLSRALVRRGHDVRVVLPRYAHLARAERDGESAVVTSTGERFRYRVLSGDTRLPPAYLVELDDPGEPGELYSGDDRDCARFVTLSVAALALPAAIGWRPDVLHCHDWHAALVPVLARRDAERPATVLTLHNVGYQGWFAPQVVHATGLVPPDELAGGDAVSLLREGIRAADMITTVSPTYAREIQTPELGMGLEDLLAARRDALVGVLNGVDYEDWSPETDPHLPEHYDARDLAPKRRLKALLCRTLGLDDDGGAAPLVGVVSRLVPQKGIDLVADALPELLESTAARFALLGSGDPALSERLGAFARAEPRRVSFTHGYDETLAHRIIAGSDLLLVPSRYEPCGLTQLYALRYGTVPVVRETGGLADSVRHFDPATGDGTGSVFRDADVGGVLWGLRTALAWYADPPTWRRLIANAMSCDFSWDHTAPAYEAIYARATR